LIKCLTQVDTWIICSVGIVNCGMGVEYVFNNGKLVPFT
jgi:hypothetical protein